MDTSFVVSFLICMIAVGIYTEWKRSKRKAYEVIQELNEDVSDSSGASFSLPGNVRLVLCGSVQDLNIESREDPKGGEVTISFSFKK